jgi:glycogen debranching enzyme
MNHGARAGADTFPVATDAPQPQPNESTWKVFGKLEGGNGDQPDPQRHIATSRIFRAGSSTCAVISEDGIIDAARAGETGLYIEDMRVVSKLSFTINGKQPVVTNVKSDALLTELLFWFRPSEPHLEVRLDYTLDDNVLLARLCLKNTGHYPLCVTIDFGFEADHYDIFYVRFPPKPARGILHPAVLDAAGQMVRYDSMDGRAMQSFIRFSEGPDHSPNGRMSFRRVIPPERAWILVVGAGLDARSPDADTWRNARNALQTQRELPFASSARIETANPRLMQWLRQAEADLSLLTANLDTGLYPYAGLPWFALPFGRDGLITGFETIEINPAIMKGVLLFHAKHQAHEVDWISQASPGKIIHEMRLGETSRIGQNPFGRYYGAVDTTPLFVMAAEAYWRRTGDLGLIQELWPNIDLALRWISDYGDLDDDSFIEYGADPGMGLTNQGWKDSWDAILDEHGDYPKGPIAVCEVQGYAFAAWRAGQAIAAKLGFSQRAEFCARAADRLYKCFNEVFWQEDLGIYALALDGKKRPCRVRASNMGHLAWCGIVPPDRAQRVLDELLGDRLFSGWGIRTLAEGEKGYRAENYHRGPCWPHEMAIASWSAENIRDHRAIQRIAEATLDTAEAFGFRLPELLSGYPRIEGVPPVSYKSANPLHAWAAAVPFALVQSALGLCVDSLKSEIGLNPLGLPRDWSPLDMHGLEVGNGCISLRLEPQSSAGLRIRILEQHGSPVRIRDGRTGKLLAPT